MKVKNPVIAVGFDETGTPDFSVLGSVGDLTLEQMNSLRTMIPVAIGVMEQLGALAQQLKDVIDTDASGEQPKGKYKDQLIDELDASGDCSGKDQDLINMLCIIHRDGGHYIAEHGMEKAYDDACDKLHRWKLQDDEPQQQSVMFEEWYNAHDTRWQHMNSREGTEAAYAAGALSKGKAK